MLFTLRDFRYEADEVEELDYTDLYFYNEECRKNKATTLPSEKFELNDLFHIERQKRELESMSYVPKAHNCFIIRDPTIREVWSSAYPDRLNHHFMMGEINPCLEEMLGKVCYNCRIGMGTDRAVWKVHQMLVEMIQEGGDVFYLKGDFTAFFMSMDRVILLKMVFDLIDNRYRGRYPKLLKYLFALYLTRDPTQGALRKGGIKEWKDLPDRKSLFKCPEGFGIEIGTLLAQGLCNLYLCEVFDRLVEGKGYRVVRYVDDWIVLSMDRTSLSVLLPEIEESVATVGLGINSSKTRIRNARYGIDFLGKRIYPYNTVLLKRTIGMLYSKGRRFETPEDAYTGTVGRRGVFLCFGARDLALRWYATLPEGIRFRFILNTDMSCSLISGEDYRRRHEMDTYKEILLKYPTIDMQEYTKVIFLYSYSRRPVCLMTNKDYRRYFWPECHLADPLGYHIDLIRKGYFRPCTHRERLGLLTGESLQKTAEALGVRVVRDKQRLIDSILSNADEEVFSSFGVPQAYVLSPQGEKYVREGSRYIAIHNSFHQNSRRQGSVPEPA